jgi:hypothetical protein
MAIVIKTDGKIEEIRDDYDSIRMAIQGDGDGPLPWLEAIGLADCIMMVDEDGRARRLKFNTIATRIRNTDDQIVGNAVLVGQPTGNGDCKPFTMKDFNEAFPEHAQNPTPEFKRGDRVRIDRIIPGIVDGWYNDKLVVVNLPYPNGITGHYGANAETGKPVYISMTLVHPSNLSPIPDDLF